MCNDQLIMTKKEELSQLYQLYLNNQCSAAELQRFFELIKADQNDPELLNLMSDTWEQTPESPEQGLIPDFLPAHTQQMNPSPVRISYGLRKIAAAAAILLLIGGIYFYRSGIRQMFNPAKQLEISSLNGQRKQLVLADGTRVWLSPYSKLHYPDRFNGSQRMVSLEGEAFFEVTSDAANPFIIQSGMVSTTVLGTSFNISAYSTQPNIQVTLVNGKVAVALEKQDHSQTILTANQQATINRTTATIHKTDFPQAATFIDRRAGFFDYKGSTFNEVINNLGTQYQQTIRLGADLDKKMFYGQLNMNLPLEQVLDKLCTVMEVSWKKDGGQYVIQK